MESDNRGPQYFVILVVMISMALTATILRIFTRLSIVKAFGRDDWFMVAAMLAFIMYTTCALGGVVYGTGQRNAALEPENIVKAMRFWWCCYVAYTSTMWFVKVSIGYYLLRVIVNRIYIRIIWTAMVVTAITGIVFTFVVLFQCNPVSYFWTRVMGGEGRCMNIYIVINLTYFYSAINALCDFTFGIIPIFVLWNLNMSKRMKLAIAPILSMGCIASCAILVRTAYCREYLEPDFLYSTVDIAIWSTIECGLAITAGSLATLRPLFRVISSKIWGHSSVSSGQKGAIAVQQQETVWPDSQDKGRKKGGLWSLLQTEHGNFELETRDRKGMDSRDGSSIPADLESLRTTGGSQRGLVIEREIEVNVESEARGDDCTDRKQRRSWLQFQK